MMFRPSDKVVWITLLHKSACEEGLDQRVTIQCKNVEGEMLLYFIPLYETKFKVKFRAKNKNN